MTSLHTNVDCVHMPVNLPLRPVLTQHIHPHCLTTHSYLALADAPGDLLQRNLLLLLLHLHRCQLSIDVTHRAPCR